MNVIRINLNPEETDHHCETCQCDRLDNKEKHTYTVEVLNVEGWAATVHATDHQDAIEQITKLYLQDYKLGDTPTVRTYIINHLRMAIIQPYEV